MRARKAGLWALSLGTLLGGCASNRLDQPISEYKSHAAAGDFVAPDSAVVSLWRWQPDDSAMTRAALTAQHKKECAIELPTEVQEMSVDGGTPLGFRKKGNRLVAIAGDREIPLPEGHYTWQLLSEDPRVPAPQPTVRASFYVEIERPIDPCDGLYDSRGMPIATAW